MPLHMFDPFHSLSKNQFILFFYTCIVFVAVEEHLIMLKKATFYLVDQSISPQCGVLSFDLTFLVVIT